MARTTKAKRVPSGGQRDLFGTAADQTGSKPQVRSDHGRVFIAPDPHEIYLGETSLKTYLEQAGLREPLKVRRLLQSQDWSTFESRYSTQGRAPYAPSAMMGLVLYGILQGVTSLRGLEKLARRDLGCMWVTGGICPDHANIGNFINQHHDLIAGSFFEGLTRTVLRHTGSSGERLAGDGTVVEAVASHYGLLKAEAAQAHAEAAQRRAASAPEDAGKQRRAAIAQQAQAMLDSRAEQRRQQGKPSGHLCVSAHEPEAMVQPLKRGRGSAPSYKPSVLANEIRVIVAHGLHPSQEAAVLPELLAQSAQVTGAMPNTLLLDAGYFSDSVIATSLAHDIDLLCPEGRGGQPKASDKYYPKGRFHYDEASDSYRCPAGATLNVIGRWSGNAKAPGYTLYGSSACEDCAQRARCTRNQKGRRIKRYAGDDAKDALRQVMQQPLARRRFKQRQAMVEPVFSMLRGQQGLHRFRRRGLAGVRTEFALHVLAYNLGRALAYRLFVGGLRAMRALRAALAFDRRLDVADSEIGTEWSPTLSSA